MEFQNSNLKPDLHIFKGEIKMHDKFNRCAFGAKRGEDYTGNLIQKEFENFDKMINFLDKRNLLPKKMV